MIPEESHKKWVIDQATLPPKFPTHKQSAQFWEHLGRTIATFGFLEEILGKAIFSLTGTRQYKEGEIQTAYESWRKTLEHALYDTLSNLIKSYGAAVQNHQSSTNENLEEFLQELEKVSEVRNALCHGSWRPTNDPNASKPLFVNRRLDLFDTVVDLEFLRQTQTAVTELSVLICNSVTALGYQFPGSKGPGKPIW